MEAGARRVITFGNELRGMVRGEKRATHFARRVGNLTFEMRGRDSGRAVS